MCVVLERELLPASRGRVVHVVLNWGVQGTEFPDAMEAAKSPRKYGAVWKAEENPTATGEFDGWRRTPNLSDKIGSETIASLSLAMLRAS
jgi:hypothetical protein